MGSSTSLCSFEAYESKLKHRSDFLLRPVKALTQSSDGKRSENHAKTPLRQHVGSAVFVAMASGQMPSSSDPHYKMLLVVARMPHKVTSLRSHRSTFAVRTSDVASRVPSRRLDRVADLLELRSASEVLRSEIPRANGVQHSASEKASQPVAASLGQGVLTIAFRRSSTRPRSTGPAVQTRRRASAGRV